MAKPNYQYEKRQRDLAKKQKQEEKRRQKLASKQEPGDGGEPSAPDRADATGLPTPGGDGAAPAET
ncbi:MAG: hypothetical protein IV085_04935 [Thiobacillus sp.]|nr:hypothetical protein [Thiobacillus sp.]